VCHHDIAGAGPAPPIFSLIVRKAIEAAGARLLYLPPYGPDLNPIEQALAKLKALLRAKALRTVEALWNALGDFVPCFSPDECANFLRQVPTGPQGSRDLISGVS
jgi:transposase